MNFPRRQRGEGHEPVIPLINVIFLLLIFFLVTGTLRSAELLEIAPPQAASGVAVDAALPSVLVSADGRVAFDGDLLEVTELGGRLASIMQGQGDSHLVVKADGQVRSELLLRVLDQIEQAGVAELSLVTELSPGS